MNDCKVYHWLMGTTHQMHSVLWHIYRTSYRSWCTELHEYPRLIVNGETVFGIGEIPLQCVDIQHVIKLLSVEVVSGRIGLHVNVNMKSNLTKGKVY